MNAIAAIEETPEFIAAQEAAEALRRKTAELEAARAARARIVEEHGRLSDALTKLRNRSARGELEVVALEELAAGKREEAKGALGDRDSRPGLALDRVIEHAELAAAAKALRKILAEMREDVGAQEKALEEYRRKHDITQEPAHA